MSCLRTLVLMILAFVASFGIVLGALLWFKEYGPKPESQQAQLKP